MLDRKSLNQPMLVAAQEAMTVKVTLQTACDAYKALVQALDTVHSERSNWHKPQANFHTIQPGLPNVTLGDMLNWLEHFTSDEGPALLKQMTGPALIKARARQLYSIMTPVMTELDHIASTPTNRNDVALLAKVLGHPRVYRDLVALYKSLGTLGRI